jgi:hypothetical protein
LPQRYSRLLKYSKSQGTKMMLAYKYGPYRHNLHIPKKRCEIDGESTASIRTENDKLKNITEGSETALLRDAFEKYQSFLAEDFEDRRWLKWSSAQMNHSDKDDFTLTCHTSRFKSTVLSRKDIIFKDACVEDIANAHKFCYQDKSDQIDSKLIQVKDDRSVVQYIQNTHDIAGRIDIVLEISSRKTKNGTFLFIRDVKHTDVPVIPQVQRISYWFAAVLRQESNNVRQISFEVFDKTSNSFFGHEMEEVRSDYQLLVRTMRRLQSRRKEKVAQQHLSSLTPIQRAYRAFQEYSAEDLEDHHLKWLRTFLNDTRRVGLRITAHTRKMENGRTLLRSKVVFVNADLHDIADSVTTFFKNKESFKNHKILETKEDGSIVQSVRFETGIPFMRDREIVMEATKNGIQDGVFVFNHSVEHPNRKTDTDVVTADYWYVAKLEKNGRNIMYESYQYLDCKHSWINDIDLNDLLDNYVIIVKTMRKDRSAQNKRPILKKSATLSENVLSTDRSFQKYQEFNSEDLADKRLRWSRTQLDRTKKNGYHITCHTRGIQDTVLVRSDISYQGTTVINVARAIPACVLQHSTLKMSKVLQENSDGSKVYYLLYEVPNRLVADREIILEIKKRELLDGRTFICMRSVDHPDAPIIRKVVRGTFWCGTLLSQHNDNVSLLSFEYCDVKHKILNSFDATSTLADCDRLMKFLRQNSNKTNPSSSSQ